MGLEQNHGGQYLAFQTYVQSFFTTLEECGIKPYVVLDGGSGTSNIKLETNMERGGDKVRRANSAAQRGNTEDILPVLTQLVFQQTLIDMAVPLVKCIGEADCELAALASEWRCPVLSKDSDFYIFDLPAGFLPLDHFRWEAADSYIPCKRYTTSHFCSFFKINDQFLPAFATLAGNDYVNLREIKWVKFLPGGRRRKTYRIASLEGLLNWLRCFQTTEDAIRAAMTLMPNVSRQEQTMVEKATLEYRLPSSSLQGFFTEGAALSLPKEVTWVPDWVCASLAKGDLSGDVLDMLLLGRRNMHKPVEFDQLPSSNLVSQPIRQVLYGLLPALGRSGVLEVDRVGLDLHTVTVKPVVQGATQGLRLDSLPQADRTVRLKVCLETLGVNQETLEGVPPHLRLPVAVTCYWLRRAKPDLKLLKSLLMVMIQGELNRQEGLTTALKIHVSSAAREVLQEFSSFQLELRGNISVKGKGSMTTYWLLGESDSQ
ncbi:hypothetical protein NHX12_001418 [Muraenolepis orangiensis]|uniref:Guanylate cyclase domain-containing protein n=1 Tax=Muraenolepis orangiensis TaxID=630683 RepID=A0A9Q0E4H5_9TELE|nr:hypothetical protein NHX12_001418 [Muraenolepis orangiensis]